MIDSIFKIIMIFDKLLANSIQRDLEKLMINDISFIHNFCNKTYCIFIFQTNCSEKESNQYLFSFISHKTIFYFCAIINYKSLSQHVFDMKWSICTSRSLSRTTSICVYELIWVLQLMKNIKTFLSINVLAEKALLSCESK